MSVTSWRREYVRYIHTDSFPPTSFHSTAHKETHLSFRLLLLVSAYTYVHALIVKLKEKKCGGRGRTIPGSTTFTAFKTSIPVPNSIMYKLIFICFFSGHHSSIYHAVEQNNIAPLLYKSTSIYV